jgi:hypothetical protein
VRRFKVSRCGDCKFRQDGACSFSEDKENPARPNFDEMCIWSPSKFERKEDPWARVISPRQEPNPAPMNPEIRGPVPKPRDSMCYIQRGNHQRFWKDQDGNCWADKEKTKFLGRISDLNREAERHDRQKMVEDILNKPL